MALRNILSLFAQQLIFKIKRCSLIIQILVNFESFALMYNCKTKFELFRYWQKLEEKSYDPVVEFNRSLQNFDIVNLILQIYHPDLNDMFFVITMVAKFLKEYSDFESCPNFRHPSIRG